MKEEFRAVFMGKETFKSVWMRIDNETVFVRVPFKLFPFLSKYKPLMRNVSEKLRLYYEKKLLDNDFQRSESKVTIFPIDLDTFDEHELEVNREASRLIKDLQAKNDILSQENRDLKSLLEDNSNSDTFKRRTKDEYSFWTGLKPDFMFNQNNQKDKKK
jgi:hypothetical protein